MNESHDRVTAVKDVANEVRKTHARETVGLAAWIGILGMTAALISAWLMNSTGVPQVSADAGDPSAHVPYYPSQYVNQATEQPPATPTF